MTRRSLRLLDAGRAPAAWMRDAERRAARLHALERGAAWAPALAAVRPALRRGPLLGGALDALATLDPPASSPSTAEGPAPASPPRRVEPLPATRRSSPGADPSAAGSPDRPAPRPRTPRERRASHPPDTAHHGPRAARLPRRADEATLRRAADPAAPSIARTAAGPGGRWSSASAPGMARDGVEWEAILRRAAYAAVAPSPGALPGLALPDRLRGALAGGSGDGVRYARPLPPLDRVRVLADATDPGDPGHAAGAGRWIGAVARRAIRRFLRTAAGPVAGTAGHRPMDAAAADLTDPHRPALSDVAGLTDPHRPALSGVAGLTDPHRPALSDVAGFTDPHRLALSGVAGFTDPRRPVLAEAGDTAAPHRPMPAEAEDGGLAVSPALAREWGAPLDGPAAPADVLECLAAGRPRAAERGNAPTDAASLLRQARRAAAGPADGTHRGDAAAAPFAESGAPRRGSRAVHVPSLVRTLADGAASTSDDPFLPRAIRTADGVLRLTPRPLLAVASRREPAGDADAADAESLVDAGCDRWTGWPAVLPWPRRRTAPLVDGAEARPGAARVAASPAERARRPAIPTARETAAADAAPAPAAASEAAPRAPIATVVEPYRPAAPLPPAMTPGPFPPRTALLADPAPASAAGETARPPAPLATGEDAAPWAEGWGSPVRGAYAAAGHPFAEDAARAADELDDALARRLKRILDEEARRYGIDV